MEKNERAARLLATRPRVFWGKVVQAVVREGWNPPPPRPEVAARLLDDIERVKYNATLDLGPRERECLALVAEGLQRREIADRLGLSEESVKDYLARARARLGARNSTHAVAIAIRDELI